MLYDMPQHVKSVELLLEARMGISYVPMFVPDNACISECKHRGEAVMHCARGGALTLHTKVGLDNRVIHVSMKEELCVPYFYLRAFIASPSRSCGVSVA
jgi:hypothetical protein